MTAGGGVTTDVSGEGLLWAPGDRLLADASEVPTSKKATATATRADLVMLLLQAPLDIELWAFQIIIKQDHLGAESPEPISE
jgi:hypothetical protein